MTLRNVTLVRVKDLDEKQKEELQIDSNVKNGLVAIETHNTEYNTQAKIIKNGLVEYILNGE